MAFVNFDSYDRRFMGVVGRKEMVLESQSGEKGEALIAGHLIGGTQGTDA